jgi:hypothetical protein
MRSLLTNGLMTNKWRRGGGLELGFVRLLFVGYYGNAEFLVEA